MLNQTKLERAATVTRNPATIHLIGRNFTVVSPDLQAADPLYLTNVPEIAAITEAYAKHIGAHGPLPIVTDRYERAGLYGGADPGKAMPIPQVANYRTNAVIVTGTERRQG